MDEEESLNHTKWECKYHVVFIPKCRRKSLYQGLRRYLGEVFRRLAEQKESQIEGERYVEHRAYSGAGEVRLSGAVGLG